MTNAINGRGTNGPTTNGTTNRTNSNSTTTGPNGTAPAPTRRKSVEFDLALRNTTTTDKINKPTPFASMLNGSNGIQGGMIGPIPQPRRSLMSAATTYDTQFYMQHTQAAAAAAKAQAVAMAQHQQHQLYQNHAQLQYQILQQQYAQQQLQQLQMAQRQQQQQQTQQIYGTNAIPPNSVQLAAVQQAQAAAAASALQQQQRRPRPLVRHTEAEHV